MRRIEVLVATVMRALLAYMAVPTVLASRHKSRAAAALRTATRLQQALASYALDADGRDPPAEAVPTCAPSSRCIGACVRPRLPP